MTITHDALAHNHTGLLPPSHLMTTETHSGGQAGGMHPTGMLSCLFMQILGGKLGLVAVRKSPLVPTQTQPTNSRTGSTSECKKVKTNLVTPVTV